MAAKDVHHDVEDEDDPEDEEDYVERRDVDDEQAVAGCTKTRLPSRRRVATPVVPWALCAALPGEQGDQA